MGEQGQILRDSDPIESATPDGREGSLLALGLLALVVDALPGLIGALFRLSLREADSLRNAIIAWAHNRAAVGFLVVLVSASAVTALAAAFVRLAPLASGSGIPHVEAVLRGKLPPAPFRLIPAKFFGGVLAIGAGLALGREGPTVQMGTGIARVVGNCSAEPGLIAAS
jgi:CIC family chloride channel protein